jgi:hypothetical protein
MGVFYSDLIQRGNRGGLSTTFFLIKEGQLIETMNSKRSASSRTQKPTSSPRNKVAQASLSQDVSELAKTDALTELMNHIPQLLSTMTSLTAQFQENQQQQQQLNLLLSQVLQTLASNGSESFAPLRQSGRKASGTAAIAKGSFVTLESKELKKSHAKGSAEEKLKRTFEAIVSHNEAADRTHAEKWAINQNALAELTGCNRPAIKQFLKEYAGEIERHHQAHELLPRHNYAHGKLGVKITDIIAW